MALLSETQIRAQGDVMDCYRGETRGGRTGLETEQVAIYINTQIITSILLQSER